MLILWKGSRGERISATKSMADVDQGWGAVECFTRFILPLPEATFEDVGENHCETVSRSMEPLEKSSSITIVMAPGCKRDRRGLD